MNATDDVYRISDGVLVSPFTDTAVAVDLMGGVTHVLSPAAAWLMTQPSPVDIAALIADVAEPERDELVASILDALDTLRTPGLVDRPGSYDVPEPPGEVGYPTPGAHVGNTHAVIDGRIAFRSDDAGLVARIDTFLGDSIDEPAARHFDVVPDGDGTIGLYAADEWRFEAEDQLIRQLPTVLNDDGARTHGAAVIHAGTVRTPDGRTIVLAGPPNAGKSTLTAALVAAGCDYLGDESVGITVGGPVFGYPKPLTLSNASRGVLGLGGSDFPHARIEELRRGARTRNTAPHIDEILVVRYDPDHTGMLTSRPLEPVAALEAVLANTLNLARSGEPGLDAICALVESVPVTPLVHPGVETAVPVILGT